jgi:hypothetical protein
MIFRVNFPNILYQYPLIIHTFLGVVYWTFFLEAGKGDEGLMAQYLDEAGKQGFYWVFQSGNFSIPHGIIVYPLSLFFPSYLTLRIVSLIGTVFIFIYLTRRHHLSQTYSGFLLLFYLASGSFLLGTNDNLFICFLTIFISEALLLISDKTVRLPEFAWFCLISAFFTREMAIIYLPLIIGFLILIVVFKKFRASDLIVVSISALFWITLNIPAIIQHGSISYDNKNMPKQYGITWPQRQYLSQLYANQGIIPEFSHVSWEETRSYLEKNGIDSLPPTTFKSLTHDIKLTWKEFWKDLLFLLYSGFRQVGMAAFLPFLVFLVPGPNNQTLKILGLGQLLQMLIFSFIIISYIEIRWLTPVFILGILGLDLLIKDQKHKIWFEFFNKIILTILSIYSIAIYFRLIQQSDSWVSLFG